MTNEVAEAEMGVAELTTYFGGELSEAVDACRRAEEAKQSLRDQGGALRARFTEALCRLRGHDFETAERLLRQIRSAGLDGVRIPDALVTLYEGLVALQLGQLERAAARRHALTESGSDFAGSASNRKALLVLDVALALAEGRIDEARALEASSAENEAFDGALHAMIVAAHPGETSSEQVRSWSEMRPAFEITRHSLGLTQAQAFVEARLMPLQRRLRALESAAADVVATHDFQLFRVADDWVDSDGPPDDLHAAGGTRRCRRTAVVRRARSRALPG